MLTALSVAIIVLSIVMGVTIERMSSLSRRVEDYSQEVKRANDRIDLYEEFRYGY